MRRESGGAREEERGGRERKREGGCTYLRLAENIPRWLSRSRQWW